MQATAVLLTTPNAVEVGPGHCPEPGPSNVVVHIPRSWISNGTGGPYLRGERCDGGTPFAEGDLTPFPVVAGYQKIGEVEGVRAELEDLEIVEAGFAAARLKVDLENVTQRARRTVAIFGVLREHATFGLEHWGAPSSCGDMASTTAERPFACSNSPSLAASTSPPSLPYAAAQPQSRRRQAAAVQGCY